MQNITVEELKADAARLGFNKKPMDELIKMIEASIYDQFQKFEIQLNIMLNLSTILMKKVLSDLFLLQVL